MKHFDRVRDGLVKANESYNQAVGSFESRGLPSANRLKELAAPDHGEALECPAPVEVALRVVPAQEPARPKGGQGAGLQEIDPPGDA